MEPLLGRVGHIRNTIAITPAISAAAIYAAGDAVGGLLTFTLAGRMAGGTGLIESVTLIDDDSEDAATNLVLFDRAFTPTADNAPFSPSDADLANCIGYIPIPAANYATFVNNSVATVRDVGLAFLSVDGNIYGQLVTLATPTYTAVTDLTVKVAFLQD